MNKTILVCGAGGFIGGHLVKFLKNQGNNVQGVDIKWLRDWWQLDKNGSAFQADLSDMEECMDILRGVDEVYNLAADMGGIGFIEGNKKDCMLSVLINTNLLLAASRIGVKRFFFSSSACVYPSFRQDMPTLCALKEEDAYPAMPEDGYGWEKLFSERMCHHFGEETGMQVRIARYHNVYGPKGTWRGGREKAPAAICRKVALAKLTGSLEIEIWGDGEQTRSFMYVDDCVLGTEKIMQSDIESPVNLGSSELVSVNELVDIVEYIAGVKVKRNYILDAPKGVRGRNSDNTFIQEKLEWQPSISLMDGIEKTYSWIEENVRSSGM